MKVTWKHRRNSEAENPQKTRSQAKKEEEDFWCERERERERERDGVECNSDRSTVRTGYPDVLQRSPQTPLHAPYVFFNTLLPTKSLIFFLFFPFYSSILFMIIFLVYVNRSVGTCGGHGIRSCFCESIGQMGCSA